MKRITTLLLAIFMVLGTVNISNATTGNEKIDYLIDKSIVTGDEGGYRLNDTIRRSEIAALIVRALNEEDISSTLKGIDSKFSDMNSSNVGWARGYVNYVSSYGYVNGYPDGNFGPNRNITYEEIIKILVMMNGDIPATTGYEGSTWAVPYIIKANEVGITEGVTITNNNYKQPAIREKVFEMVYNTINLIQSANQETYKGIVTKNSRVSDLDKDEIGFVVFAKGNNSLKADLRYDKNSEITVKLSSEFDSEALLGKVIDLTIDKNNKILKAVIDNSYSYINGLIEANKSEIRLENNDTYDVYMENRYTNTIDRVFGVYHNDKEYEYDKYLESLDTTDGTKDDSFIPEHAKVTVKGNRTYFIESFTFDDIAPVIEVKRSGEEVNVYDDIISAGKAGFILKDAIAYTDKGYKSIGLSSIEVGDVVHVYNSNKAIVRQDAEQFGEYDRTLEAAEVYYIEIDGSRYQIRNSAYKRPVYSLDGNKYFTLMASSASSSLEDLKDKDITYLLDVNNHVQLIKGNLKYDESTVVIDEIGIRDIKVIDSSDAVSTFKVDNYSNLYIANSNTNRSLSDFSRGDIVYLFNNESMVNTLFKMDTATNIDANAKNVLKTSKGEFDINLNNSWIRLESGIFELTKTTNVFIVEINGVDVTNIEATTLERIKERAKPGTDLRAYIISEKDFNSLNVGNEVKYGNFGTVAHTIIFTDFTLNDSFLQTETVQLSFDYNLNTDNEIIGKDSEGNEVELKVKKYANILDMETDDVVTLFIDENNEVVDMIFRIKGSNKVYEVIDIERISSKIEAITLKSDLGEEERFVSRNLIIFGNDKIREGDKIAFGVDDYGDIEVIVVLL